MLPVGKKTVSGWYAPKIMLEESFSTWKTWATSREGPCAGSVLLAPNVSNRTPSESSVSALSPVEISHPFPL